LPKILNERAVQPLIVHFFFNDRGDDNEKSELGMLRALLFQICTELPSILDGLSIMQIYETLEAKAQQQSSKVEWPLHDLRELFSELHGNNKVSAIYIVVDSLDECDSSSRLGALKLLQELTSTTITCQFKILLTSRPHALNELLDITFKECPRIRLESIDGKHTSGDVERFVQNEFANLSRKEELRDLRDLIIARAQGIFLWAAIVMNKVIPRSKKGDKVQDLVAMVEDLPSEMDELYKKVLDQLTDEKDIEDRRIMLQWVLFAQRPLTISEFRIAIELGRFSRYPHETRSRTRPPISSNASKQRLKSESQLLKHSFTEDVLKERLVTLSGSLLEVKPSGSASVKLGHDHSDNDDDKVDIGNSTVIVQLIHQSAKEYLLGHRNDWALKHDLESADGAGHLYLTLSCFEYLAFKEFGEIPVDPSGPRFSSLKPFTNEHHFLEYSALYWPTHAGFASRDTALREQFLFLIDQKNNFSLAIGILHLLSWNVPLGSPLHITSRYGLDYLVGGLLEQGVDPDSMDRAYGQTPLSWAAGNGHEAVVRLLLARDGVDPDSKDYVEGRTPLSWAAGNGHEAVVRLLLARDGVDPDSEDNVEGRTPLSWAAGNGHEAMVRLLLARDGVDPDSKDIDGWTPLSWAAENEHEAVVKLLQ
jgi:ankyrin repeat protein